MKHTFMFITKATILVGLTISLILTGITQAQIKLADLMPDKNSFTEIWWKEGMPDKVKGAPWHRCILGGNYAMVLDTEKISIPHMGEATAKSIVSQINTLPSADLQLSISLKGKEYRCVGALPFDRNTGPRLVEAGYFFQRADVTDLIFAADDGQKLETLARFETSAWSDRLSFMLHALPGEGSSEAWQDYSIAIQLSNADGTLQKTASNPKEGKLSLVFNPVTMKEVIVDPQITIKATDVKTDSSFPVNYDHNLGWHEIDISGAKANLPKGNSDLNNSIEKIHLALSNPTATEQTVPLLFKKRSGNFSQRIGSSITGVTAMIRDLEGNPTGIPVQLSKNWHKKANTIYSGSWFHGITKIKVPANSHTKLELVIANAHWGGVAAASHAQLSLIGWGSNQLWEQSALGAWGESICYEPDQAQASCLITDVRPVMTKARSNEKAWGWTGNVGGGDYFKLFNSEGERIYHSSVRTTRLKQGPCLTEITYSGSIDQKSEHSITTSISRSDDIVRGTYHIKMKVNEKIPFSRFAIFQVGADTYNMSAEKMFAAGDVTKGLINEWKTQNAGGAYISPAVEYTGDTPWFSLHDAEPADKNGKCLANRGFIIRSWKARLGGKDAKPWVAEYGAHRHKRNFSILDITPPNGVSELLAGDYVDAVIEYIVMPQSSEHYYGPSKQLKNALKIGANSWKMIFREAKYNNHLVKPITGELIQKFPDVRIKAENNQAKLEFKGGLGYVPFTFTGLKSHSGYSLQVNGTVLDQSVHGNDFWQTDYDFESQTWSITYNVPITSRDIYILELSNQF